MWQNEIKEAYEIIIQNSINQNYTVRSWEDISEALIKLVKEKNCLIPYCKHENQIIGALIIFETGKRPSYLFGGTIRTKPNLKVGQFMHFEMMKYSINNNYEFYDLLVGGVSGVIKFKESMGGVAYKFIEPRYWVMNTLLFKLYEKFLPKLQKNKVLISKILKLVKWTSY